MVADLLHTVFTESFVPHGHCYLWKPELVWTNVISDALITLAYYSIPLVLVYIVRKRADVPFDWVFFLFGGFIVACGTGHLLEIWTLWHPMYWLSTGVKVFTAGVSVTTGIVMLFLIPQILMIPSPAQLQTANQTLEKEILERQQAEQELQQSEIQLRQQTHQLEAALMQLRQTQSQLIQTEKMSSLGQLVAGIAHEINNPVNFIYGNLVHTTTYVNDLLDLIALYQLHCPDPPVEICDRVEEIDLDFLHSDLPQLLSSMKIGADRIRQIVVSLRNFSRFDQSEVKWVNIHEGIDSTLMILQHRLKPGAEYPAVEIVKDYGVLPAVECYAGQLNQVFINLISNAIDAVRERLAFWTLCSMDQSMLFDIQKKCFDDQPVIQIRTEKVGTDQIKIVIADNGLGIPPSIRDRLFDPFFTTKPVGKGTGLGLSISYEIVVNKHGGSLDYSSTPGNTEFHVTIPIQQPANLIVSRA